MVLYGKLITVYVQINVYIFFIYIKRASFNKKTNFFRFEIKFSKILEIFPTEKTI